MTYIDFFHLQSSQWFHFSMKINLQKLDTCLQSKFHHSEHDVTFCGLSSDQWLLHGKVVCDSWWESFAVYHKLTEKMAATSSTSSLELCAVGSMITFVSCCIHVLYERIFLMLLFNVFLVFTFHLFEPFCLLLGLVTLVKCFASCCMDCYEIWYCCSWSPEDEAEMKHVRLI